MFTCRGLREGNRNQSKSETVIQNQIRWKYFDKVLSLLKVICITILTTAMYMYTKLNSWKLQKRFRYSMLPNWIHCILLLTWQLETIDGACRFCVLCCSARVWFAPPLFLRWSSLFWWRWKWWCRWLRFVMELRSIEYWVCPLAFRTKWCNRNADEVFDKRE